MDLNSRLDQLKQRAMRSGIPVRLRGHNKNLYDMLAACLELCEEVIRDGKEPQLREACSVKSAGLGLSLSEANSMRRFTFKNADAFRLVCRYVLQDSETPQSISKYCFALREAHKRQISSAKLVDWLIENGGVLAMYRSRSTLGKRAGGIRELTLLEPVDFPRDGSVFTLRLRYNGLGAFHVIDQEKTGNSDISRASGTQVSDKDGAASSPPSGD